MSVILGRNHHLSYLVLLISAEVFGIISIILVGFFFHKPYPNVYDWKEFPFAYHPLYMTLGFLFFYGNAILLYRTFLQTPKIIMKILHAFFLMTSFIFAIVGLVAIIKQKNKNTVPVHFLTFHSWIGLTTFILFFFQWICGFVCYLFPGLSLNVRKAYMPSHRLWGKLIFVSAVISMLTGLSEHGMSSGTFSATNGPLQSRRLIINFYAVFATLFCVMVIYLLSNPDYQRPADNIAEPPSKAEAVPKTASFNNNEYIDQFQKKSLLKNVPSN